MKVFNCLKNELATTLAWLAVIWILSSIPSTDLPSVKILGFDKVSHFGVYFFLGLLLNRWLKKRGYSRQTVALIYALLLLNAALDEWHQILIPGRSVSLWDLSANFLGVLAARLTLRPAHD